MNRMWMGISLVSSSLLLLGLLLMGAMPLVFNQGLEDTRPLLHQEAVSRWILVALVITSVGVAASVIFSRRLTAPLSQLAQTARAFSAKRNNRAELKGSVELVTVAKVFNEMADALDEAEMSRWKLLANVSRELQRPVEVLQTNLQAMLNSDFPPERSDIVCLAEQTELLSHIRNDLHQLALMGSKQMRLELSDVVLPAFINGSMQKFHMAAATHNIRLAFIPHTRFLHLNVDPILLEQVLNNLIQNALSCTPSGGEVRIRLTTDSRRVYISFDNTGSGVPAESLAEFFDRFYRADLSDTEATDDAGLALAIVKAFVEMHGGQVSASNGTSDEGTNITVSLPMN